MNLKKVNLYEIAIKAYIFGIFIFREGNFLINIFRIIIVGIGIINLFKNSKLKVTEYQIWGMVFIMFCFFSAKWAVSSNTAIKFSLTVTYVFLCNYFIVLYLTKNSNFIYDVLKTLIWATMVGTIFFYYKNLSAVLAGSRVNGGANAIGMECGFVVCMIIALMKKGIIKNKYKWIYVIIMCVSLLLLLLSGSRKALLIVILPIGIYYIMSSASPILVVKNIIIALIIAVVALWGVLNIPTLYDIIGYRVETLLTGFQGGETDESTATRMRLISDGIEMFYNKPWFGYGIANYSVYHSMISDISYYAHNNYIELLVDVGIIGIIIYYSLYIKILFTGWRNKWNLDIIALMSYGFFIATMISEYGMVSYYGSYEQLLIALMWFIICGTYSKSNKKVIKERE